MKFLIIFVILSQALQFKVATASLKCYSGTRNEFLGSELTSSTCTDTGDACYVVKMTQSVSSITSDTIVSMCLNKEACKMVTCAAIKNAMPSHQESVTKCKVICCTSDLCLDDDSVSIGSSSAPPSIATTQSVESAISTTIKNFEMATPPLKCYSGTRNTLLSWKFTTSTCANTGDACYVAKMTQSVSTITTDTIVSMCLNKEACKMVTCTAIKNAMPAYKESVTDCKVICCTSDLCLDDDSVSVSSSSAPPSTTTTQSVASAISTTIKNVQGITNAEMEKTTSGNTVNMKDAEMEKTTSGNTVNMKGSVFVVSLFTATVILIFMATN